MIRLFSTYHVKLSCEAVSLRAPLCIFRHLHCHRRHFLLIETLVASCQPSLATSELSCQLKKLENQHSLLYCALTKLTSSATYQTTRARIVSAWSLDVHHALTNTYGCTHEQRRDTVVGTGLHLTLSRRSQTSSKRYMHTNTKTNTYTHAHKRTHTIASSQSKTTTKTGRM